MTGSKWLSEISAARDHSHQPQRTAQYDFQHWPKLTQTSPGASTPSATSDSSTGSSNTLNLAAEMCWGTNTARAPQCPASSLSSPPIEFEMSYWDCSPESDQPPSEYDLGPWATADYLCAAETVPSVRDVRKERRRQQNRMAQQAYRVRQQSTLGSLRADCDLLRKENLALKEQLMHKEDVLSMDVGSISGASGSDWSWLVDYADEEQPTIVIEQQSRPCARVWSRDGVLLGQRSRRYEDLEGEEGA